MAYLFRYKAALLGGFLFILAANIVALVLPYLIRLAVDSLQAGVNSGLLLRYGLLIVVVGLLQAALQFFGRFFPSKASRQIEYELRANLFKHLEKLELNYFQYSKVGDLVARATNDLTAVRGLLGPGISNLLNTVVAFIATVTFMFSIDAQLTLYSVTILPLITIVFLVVEHQIELRYKRVQDQFGEVSARAQENFSGIRVVKAYTYDVQKGSIRIDGMDVRDVRQKDLRQHIGTVLQDPFIFSGTIASNIRLHNEQITDAQLRKAAAYVNAAHFIEQLPHGHDEEVRERGAGLSVGEKQLLSFARAIAFNPEILLILDEATSSVDTETEVLIQDALNKIMTERTSIIIAHRLSTIRNVDRIIVLHKGRIVEEGTHEELLGQQGVYRRLYEYQYAQ